MIKYYKASEGIYKVDGRTLYTTIINPFDYTIINDKQEYSSEELLLNSLKEEEEITQKEYDKLFDRFIILMNHQKSLNNDIKEFINNYLS